MTEGDALTSPECECWEVAQKSIHRQPLQFSSGEEKVQSGSRVSRSSYNKVVAVKANVCDSRSPYPQFLLLAFTTKGIHLENIKHVVHM